MHGCDALGKSAAFDIRYLEIGIIINSHP